MRTKANYGWLDRFRVAAALLAITNHTAALANINTDANFFLTSVLARVVVPFFFMVTGQFVASAFLTPSPKNGPRLIKYLRKTTMFYVFCILLYLPIGIYAGHYKDMTIGSALRMFLFDGTFYHLWYFPACILGMLLVYLMSLFMRLRGMTILSIILYMIGLFGDSYYGLIEKVPVLDAVYGFGFQFFSYTRNGIFMAPIFLVLGAWMAVRSQNQETQAGGRTLQICIIGLTLSFSLMTIEAFLLRQFHLPRHDSMYVALIPTMFFLYQCLLCLPKSSSKSCRTASTWIYILHPAFIVVVRAIAKLLHLSDLLVENNLIHHLAVTLLSVAAGLFAVYIEDVILPRLQASGEEAPGANLVGDGSHTASAPGKKAGSKSRTMPENRGTKSRGQNRQRPQKVSAPEDHLPQEAWDWDACEPSTQQDWNNSAPQENPDWDTPAPQENPDWDTPAPQEQPEWNNPIPQETQEWDTPQPQMQRSDRQKRKSLSPHDRQTWEDTPITPQADSTARPINRADSADAPRPRRQTEPEHASRIDGALQELQDSRPKEPAPSQGARKKRNHRARAWIEIDVAALEHNVSFLRTRLPENCRLMPAVKADGYGHGAIVISKLLSQMEVDAFCVACLSEGISMREAGITGEILILGYTSPADFPLLVHYQLTQAVVDYDYALMMEQFGKTLHVHIAIDTGMHRLGIRCENIDEIIEVFEMRNLVIDGLFTHLSSSDSLRPEARSFTDSQVDAFYQVIHILEDEGYPCRGLHLLASYGILNLLPDGNPLQDAASRHQPALLAADYVRPGIVLYGLLSTGDDCEAWQDALRPVLSLKSRVISVRTLYAGEAAGYGMAFTAEADMRIATICIGYADGLPRELSHQRGCVLINGYRAPIIGRICMDQTIVDVTEIPELHPGDTAVIIGRSGNQEITAGDLARQCDTITNEILSRLGARLEQVLK